MKEVLPQEVPLTIADDQPRKLRTDDGQEALYNQEGKLIKKVDIEGKIELYNYNR